MGSEDGCAYGPGTDCGMTPIALTTAGRRFVGAADRVTNSRSVRRTRRILFVSMLLLGATARLGYGVARYHSSFSRSGDEFIRLWDYDGLEHVLIAKALVENRVYRVAVVPGVTGKHVRAGAHDALFKAPLYETFLAAAFTLSGFSFALFFPLQALLGGLLSGLAALIALDSFEGLKGAYFAGCAAAVHPILVNSAAQPYNENLFFALMFGSVFAFVQWIRHQRGHWALACGAVGGLAILCRETALPLLVAMVLFALFAPARRTVRLQGICLILTPAVLVIAPWSVRNYVREGVLVPVAAVTGTGLGIGNNECVAQGSLSTVYWAEDACRALDVKRALRREQVPAAQRGSWVVEDRIYGALGAAFVVGAPTAYVKLCLRRLWTVVLPFHPRLVLGRLQRVGSCAYWMMIFPAGVIGVSASLRRPKVLPMLLVLLIVVSILPLILIYFSPDMRYRVGTDLLLACFAGCVYERFLIKLRAARDCGVRSAANAIGDRPHTGGHGMSRVTECGRGTRSVCQ